MNCEGFKERLIDLAEGAAEAPAETLHLAKCDGCRVLLAQSRKICEEVSALPLLDIPDRAYEVHLGRRRSRASRRFWLPISAAAAAVIGIGTVVLLTPRYEPLRVAIRDVEDPSGLLPEDAWIGGMLRGGEKR